MSVLAPLLFAIALAAAASCFAATSIERIRAGEYAPAAIDAAWLVVLVGAATAAIVQMFA